MFDESIYLQIKHDALNIFQSLFKGCQNNIK